MTGIRVRGAREHNLKNIDVDLPHHKLIVMTGLSGSGKSSLAFDTLYAEGQRRYVESLSAYARQFLEVQNKPDVDSIEGLSPAISIDQKTTSHNPRSTVGTTTEIYDYLRLLFARIGCPHSPATGLPIRAQTSSDIADQIKAYPEGTRLMILAPVVEGRKGEYKKEMQNLLRQGFSRVMVDGKLYDLDRPPELKKTHTHTLEVVIDRLVIREGIETRLADTVERALQWGHGKLVIYLDEKDERVVCSQHFACPVSGFTLSDIEPRLFSFNSTYGACSLCDGLGEKVVFDPDRIIDPEVSLARGAVLPWAHEDEPPFPALYEHLHHLKLSLHTPFGDYPEAIQQELLWGGKAPYARKGVFEGLIPYMTRRFQSPQSDRVREHYNRYQKVVVCEACEGKRLKPEALCVKIDRMAISDVTRMNIKQSLAWVEALPPKLTEKDHTIGRRILKEIQDRLQFLNKVGLGYLTLSRSSSTLSGGESQRIRLASQIGSGLTGVLYVLDEPSIGLHQRDNDRLLETLVSLRDLGNTVIVVEHDEDAIRQADYVVDMGPAAGVHGGEIMAQGTPGDVINNPQSLTGQYLKGVRAIPVPSERRSFDPEKVLHLVGARHNNLKNIEASFPLGVFTCVTGVSGGGKSSLVIDTLYQALSRACYRTYGEPGAFEKLDGLHYIDKVIDIDQSPIGRTPRSNPATYTGVFTAIRDWFTQLPESKARGYAPGRFSFNVKGGRCEACEGDGVIKVAMHFLPDVYVTCESCQGKRYNRETLEITYHNKNIADVLNMTVDEGLEFFQNMPVIYQKLSLLQRVGLGYVAIGQRATTLSGGEAQRVKLAKELSKRPTGRTVYILDEPTTGLHFGDVEKLLQVLHQLVDQGNTVIVIEHHLEVIKNADWILDLGPEGGEDGGYLLACGTPEDIVKNAASVTGPYLKRYVES